MPADATFSSSSRTSPWRANGRRSFFVGFALVGLLLIASPSVQAETLFGFQRGDCNADGVWDISDPILVLQLLFIGPPEPQCLDACDMDDSGTIDVNDVVFALDRIFMGPLPFSAPSVCGVDPTIDALDCGTGFCSMGEIVDRGAFTLETGRVGEAYTGDLPENFQNEFSWDLGGGAIVFQPEISYVEFGYVLDNELPSGLQLDSFTGVVSGTPTAPGVHRRQIWARQTNDDLVIYELDIPVFSADESEFGTPQGLDQPGTFQISVQFSDFDYDHQLPWPPPYPLFSCNNTNAPPPNQLENKAVQTIYASNSPEPLPILFFHHATGAAGTDYADLLLHLATHGMICVSVDDQFSFFGYQDIYCWGGHEEAARVLLATRDHIRAQTEDPQSALFGKVDWSRVFYGGHSRGAGAATIVSELDRNVRGLFLLQGTDARQDSWIGNTNRWNSLPDVPVVHLSAEQDFDVTYPFAERLLERYGGPTTFVSIHGGCHGLTTDNLVIGCLVCNWEETAPPVDRCRYIRRDTQMQWTEIFATAFFRRYAFGDLGMEPILYGDEYEGSVFVSHAYHRNLSSVIRVDDFTDYPTNSLGFTTLSSGSLNIAQGSCYSLPFPPPPGVEAAKNLVIDMPPLGITSLLSPVGTVAQPLDVSSKKRLTFRIKNHDIPGVTDNFGYSWLSIVISIQDTDGDFAALPLNSHLPQTEFYPDPEPAGTVVRMKYQRFLTLTIDLDDFIANNPNLDLDRLETVAFQFTTDGTSNVSPRVGLDDLQFE